MRGVLAVSSGESSSQVGRKENATVQGGVLSPCMYRERQNIHSVHVYMYVVCSNLHEHMYTCTCIQVHIVFLSTCEQANIKA